jgi:uncharacterized membrane protein YcaP (DUF421 family)
MKPPPCGEGLIPLEASKMSAIMSPTMWHDMFTLGLPLLEKILRPMIVYIFLVAALKLTGKRELAQLNPFDLVVLLTLSNTVQNAIIGDDNTVVGGIIGATALLGTNYLVVRFLFEHPKLDEFVEGQPNVLIENGQVLSAGCRAELITLPELQQAARKQGFASLEEVDRAVLEPGGTISFFAKKPSPETKRHQELLAKLDQLGQAVEQLRRGPSAV